MPTNILIAIINLIESSIVDLTLRSRSSNRANSMGDALEYYVKDLFCGSMGENSLEAKNKIYNRTFSYLGNQNNPPDIIIKGGDAIEVKKIESISSGIALNSSYPKDKLFSDSPMITQACKNCENWKVKDIIYAIGSVGGKKLRSLWFIYGDCYAASKTIYERVRDKISSGVNELQGVEFSETKELGRVNKVDPLGITDLRIRGMWHIENPIRVFDYVTTIDEKSCFSLNALILTEKYNTFPINDRKKLEKLVNNKNFIVKDVKIKSPNNPAKLLDAKQIYFTIRDKK